MIPPLVMPWIIVIFFVGGLFAWFSQRWGPLWPRWISMAILVGHMGLLVALWVQHYTQVELPSGGPWLILYRQPWIPQVGITFSLGMDGISLLLIVLSNLLAIMAVAASWNVIRERIGFFHFNLLWILAAIAGIFLALDLFLFYVFWEILLVPLYFLIAIWGYEERRIYAAVKFFIFTQASGLLMLLAILGLYFVHGRATGVYTFEYQELLGTTIAEPVARWLMLGFFIAFAVKLPVVPLHTWLPDAHAEAPTAGSVDLAGLVLKIGAYGMFRFVVPLFPKAALDFAPVAMALGIIGIVYGALVAFSQTDLKRLVAYTSISHMGFVILGIFAWNQTALQGALLIMIVHGISTGGLFILVGDLYERVHTRDLDRMGGLWSSLPHFGGVGMFLAMASLGLPALGNFVGEFLVLLGVYRVSIPYAVLGTLGFIVATIYSLWMMQRVFHGPSKDPEKEGWTLYPMTAREAGIMALTIAIVVYLGLFPQAELGTARRAFEDLELIRPEEQEQPIASEQLGFEIKTNSNFPSPASDYREVSNDRR
jgi:NADH-quinone oxidoreductase subunit M